MCGNVVRDGGVHRSLHMLQDKMLPPSKQSEGAAFSAKQPDGNAPETETEVERLSIMT